MDQTLHRLATKEREEIKGTTKQKMARRHNRGGNHLEQESNRQRRVFLVVCFGGALFIFWFVCLLVCLCLFLFSFVCYVVCVGDGGGGGGGLCFFFFFLLTSKKTAPTISE